MKNPLLAGLIICTLGGAAHAAALLQPGQVDASRLLPPPPAADSADARAEIAELHAIAARSTPDQVAAAARDANDQKPDLFNTVLGFDITTLPATTRLLTEVLDEDSADAKAAKAYFHRDRPWIADPTITQCVAKSPSPNDSYPSGHTTLAFSMGVVLASLMPDKSQIIMARAAEYGENRMVCGFHFHSDVAAGQQLGTAISLTLMQNPTFKADYDAAAAELKAAGH